MADLIDKAAAVKIALDLAVGIEKEEAEALGWGGPDPRGYHARGIMLDQAKAFRRLAAAIAALPAQGVRPPNLNISGSVSTSTAPPADGWHITISRYGVPSVMRVEGGEAFIWHDFETGMREWAIAALAPAEAGGVDLSSPVAVHMNMLRGTIAKPTVEQIIHLYGFDALLTALRPQIMAECGTTLDQVVTVAPAPVEALVKAAVDAERERCAKVAEGFPVGADGPSEPIARTAWAKEHIAAAIREGRG